MKVATLVILFLVGSAVAVPVFQLHKSERIASILKSVKLDLCNPCLQLTVQLINEALNIILNAGVVGGCDKVCGILTNVLANHTDFPPDVYSIFDTACTLGCAAIGVKEFIDLLQKADLDEFFFCEWIKLCPIDDNGDANITQLAITPNQVKKGDTFTIEWVVTTQKGTGTGEIVINIDAPDHFPLGFGFISEELKPGTYPEKTQVQAIPQGCGDQPCEEWLPGSYKVTLAICNGECGSKLPHSQIYDVATATFTVVG